MQLYRWMSPSFFLLILDTEKSGFRLPLQLKTKRTQVKGKQLNKPRSEHIRYERLHLVQRSPLKHNTDISVSVTASERGCGYTGTL